jgi:hypothetical protein
VPGSPPDDVGLSGPVRGTANQDEAMGSAGPKHALLRHLPTLEALADIWNVAVGTPVRPHPLFPMVAGPAGRRTIEHIYGSPPIYWLWAAKFWLRELASRPVHDDVRFSMHLPLPADVVVVSRGWNSGLVAVSHRANRVLKIFHSLSGDRRIQREIDTYEQFSRIGVDLPVPALVNHGTGRNGDTWLCTEFASNTRPLIAERISQLGAWHRWRKRNLEDFLFLVYKASAPTILPAGEWLTGLQSQATACVDAELAASLSVFLESARRSAPAPSKPSVVLALVHGDLKPEHVHRSGDGFAVIDWGNSIRGPIAVDWFYDLLLLRLPRHVQRHLHAYLSWLCGEREDLPLVLETILGEFFAIQAAQFGLRIHTTEWRFQMLATTVSLQLMRVTTAGFSPEKRAVERVARTLSASLPS